MDRLPLVSEYNTRKHRTIGMRPIDVTPTIALMVYSSKGSHWYDSKWVIMYEQIQDDLWEKLHAKLDHRNI